MLRFFSKGLLILFGGGLIFSFTPITYGRTPVGIGAVDQTATIAQSSDVDEVDVSVMATNVVIQPSPDDKFHVHLFGSATIGKSFPNLAASLNKGTLDVTDGLTPDGTNARFPRNRLELDLFVPQGSTCLTGVFQLQTGNLALEETNSFSNVHATDNAGDITILDCEMDSVLTHDNFGATSLIQSKSKSLVVQSRSGNIQLTDLYTSVVSANSTSGNISVAVHGIPHKVYAFTKSGNIDIALRTPLKSVKVQATSTTGGISLALPGVVNAQTVGVLNYAVGKPGGTFLKLQSGIGNIQIHN